MKLRILILYIFIFIFSCTSVSAQGNSLFTIQSKIASTPTVNAFHITVDAANNAIEQTIIGHLNESRLIQIWGSSSLSGVDDDTTLRKQFKAVVKIDENINVVLVEHARGSEDSAERRMLYWEEETLTYRFSYHHDNTIYMTRIAFDELQQSELGKKFLRELFSFKHRQIKGEYSGLETAKRLKDSIQLYLKWRLFPQRIRQQIHIIRSRLADVERMTMLASRLNFILDQIRQQQGNRDYDWLTFKENTLEPLLRELEKNFMNFRIPDKIKASHAISEVITELALSKPERLIRRLGRRGALASIKASIQYLLDDAERRKQLIPPQYYRQLYGTTINDPVVPFDEDTVKSAYETWLQSSAGADAEIDDKIFKVYELCRAQNPRLIPSLSFVRDVVDEDVLSTYLEQLTEKNKVNNQDKKKKKGIEELSYYERGKVVRDVVNEFYPGKSKAVREQARLLRIFTMSPHFRWTTLVPQQTREYISFLGAANYFTKKVFDLAGSIEVNYQHDRDDWFIIDKPDGSITINEDLFKDDLGRAIYGGLGTEKAVIANVAAFDGFTAAAIERKYNLGRRTTDVRAWETGRRRLYATYHSYNRSKVLQDRIWGRDNQAYSMKWKDAEGNESEEAWMLQKDSLFDQPIAFTRDDLLDTVVPVGKIADGILSRLKPTQRRGTPRSGGEPTQLSLAFIDPAETMLKSA
ncbi:hypothetical protein ACFL3D_01215 [Candidatus Omnitrophota bacterium]